MRMLRAGPAEISASRFARGSDRGRGVAADPRAVACQRAPLCVDVDRHQRLGGVGGGRAGDGGDVIDQGRVGLVPDRAHHRQAEQGDGAAQVLVAEGPEVGERAAAAADDGDVHLRLLRQPPQRRGDGGRGAAVLHRRVGPDDRPAPAPALEPGQQVLAGGAAARGDDADRLRQRRAAQLLLRAEEAVGLELLAQRGEPGVQVALAGEAHMSDAEAERRGGGGAARVVIEPAADDHLDAVGQASLVEREPVEVGEPDRARQGAVRVADLEVRGLARAPKTGQLAEDEHLRPSAQEPLAGRARSGRPGTARAGPGRAS